MKKIDIVDIKTLCDKNILKAFVENGVIYISNDCGEVVKVGVV